MPKLTDDELLEALGVEQEAQRNTPFSPREQRIIAGFEDIQRFVEHHGRPPQHGEQRDLFERMYAIRLERLRQNEEYRTLLKPLDSQGLLSEHEISQANTVVGMDDDDLLAELEAESSATDIQELHHVRAQSERRVAEEIAQRRHCEDFDRYKPLFEVVEHELHTGVRQAHPFGKDASVDEGDFFILGGQIVYVAAKGAEFKTPNGRPNARLRVIYSNGTESNLLWRSLERALHKDDTGRRLVKRVTESLFGETWGKDDTESGTIYVLRSQANHPFVTEHRELVHKIGVTGSDVSTRIRNAATDPTYLLAEVEVVATYKLSGINRSKLEGVLHRIFAPAQLNLTIHDRFGNPVRPKEWFLVPLYVIDEAVKRIRDGSITDVVYDPESASLVSVV